jgi:hypothetical protein
MPKTKIHIHQIGPSDFDVRRSGKHRACASYSEAKAIARDIQRELGGFDKAVIYDHVQDDPK